MRSGVVRVQWRRCYGVRVEVGLGVDPIKMAGRRGVCTERVAFVVPGGGTHLTVNRGRTPSRCSRNNATRNTV